MYERVPNWQSFPELALLRAAPSPPKELFFRGTWEPNLFSHCAAVVGSRAMTEYGRQVVERLIPQLVFEGKTVISGFMYGVDQYAHEVCLQNGGKTIAVLGWGIKYPLEDSDQRLAQRIIDTGGMLLSEWETQKPALWTFPMRNRIVAGISREVIVVEAATKSGSLITAKLATKMKRTLMAVPGPITARTSVGTNRLIADGLAQMWLGTAPKAKIVANDDPILGLLVNESLTTSEIARKLRLPVSQVGAQLSLFTLTGQIIERGGKYSIKDN